jgi:HemY protein
MRASDDPVWTADGVVSDRWLPVSPNGRLDGFEWRVPLAEIGFSRPVAEIGFSRPVIEVSAPAAESIPIAPPGSKREPPVEKARKVAKFRTPAKPNAVEPVIPLVHAPDDPGLDLGLDRDPVPETSTPPASDAWRRLRQLFR